MSLEFVLACGFALVLGGAVAFVDRWRDARLGGPRLRPGAPIRVAARATPVTRGRRAA